MTDTSFRRPEHEGSPLILNFGGGVDSTAIMVGLARLVRAGDESAKPDLILFADTGDELPRTYENVARMSRWCEENLGTGVTVVNRADVIRTKTGDRKLTDELNRLDAMPAEAFGRATCSIKWKQDPQDRYVFGLKRPHARYSSLSENCTANETLPSEAFGRGACSMKWKHEGMDALLHGRKRPVRHGWLRGQGYPEGTKPVKLIGYDATETASGKRGKWAKNVEDAKAFYRYPLVEWGWSREDCEAAIAAEGLEVPIKSACFMCPNQTEGELREMAVENPDLLLHALAIEEIAKRGKHGLTKIEGLWRRTRKSDGRSGSWVQWTKDQGMFEAIQQRAGKTLEELIAELKPEWASSARAACAD